MEGRSLDFSALLMLSLRTGDWLTISLTFTLCERNSDSKPDSE